MARIPLVEGAAVTTNLPMTGSIARTQFSMVGAGPGVEPASGTIAAVSPGYFRTMRIPLSAGREFTEADAAGRPRVVIIDQALAQRYFGGSSPIGRQLRFGTSEMRPEPWEIVGVAGHVKHDALDEGAGDLQFYYPIYQGIAEAGAALVVRSPGDPGSLARTVEDAVLRIDKDQPIYGATMMTEMLAAGQVRRRFLAVLVALFAAMATALAALGLFSLMAYAVSRRTAEVGIRMALGARPRDILTLIIRQALALVAIGAGLGLAGSAALMRGVSSMLFEVSPADPVVLGATTVLLVGVSMLACIIPARRAARVDPVVALRS